MKKSLIIIITLTLFSCGKKEKTYQEKQIRIEKNVIKELDYNIDKIVLLSNIENLPIEKINLIMQGYLKAMYDRDFNLENIEDYQNLINTISKNTSLSTKRVSSIIFAYVYEMRTKEEIGDEYIDELKEAQEDNYDGDNGYR